RKQLLALAGLGAMGYGLMSTFFFSAVELIPASITAILLYTYPVIVTVLSAWVYKEAITGYKIISLIISSIGLVMVVGVIFDGLNFLGVFYGGMAAVVYSLYVIFSNKLVGKISPVMMATYVMTAAAVVFNIVGWSTGMINLAISARGWLAILGIAVVSSVVAILTFFQGLKLVGPTRASIISTIEPVVTILAAYLLFSEKLTLVQAAGAGLVIAAIILLQKES
ncbi:MAG: EamA family transporter, partial [Eubacteriales bacterium]